MNSVMSPRLKISKSRIPVRVKKPTTSVVNDSKRKVHDKAPLPTSAKLSKYNNLKYQSKSKVVKPAKTTEGDKCIRTLKYDRNRQSSITSNSKVSDINKKTESSQLKNSVKERILKSKDTVLKGKIINDTGKRKIATLKTNAPTSKKETEDKTIKPVVESSGSSDKLAPSRSVSKKENKASSKPRRLAAQTDIKFEVNENSRKMILREHAPSPGLGNKLSGFRLSSRPSQRPSIYQPMEMVADPYKEAIRAIACFSEKRKRENYNSEKTVKLLSPFMSKRSSIYQPMEMAADPYKEAMRAIACYSEKRKQEKLNSEKSSKLLDRNSFYTPCADPKKEVMESLMKVKLKQQSNKLTPSRCLSEKENKASLRPSILAAQKDVKFEVNENSRKMILREQAPSPGIGNKMSGFRLSSRPSQRPSIYQPMEMAADPYKEAMRAIACYSEKRKQEKLNSEKSSNLLDRNSLCTPCADPKKEVMESLRKLTLKQEQQKSTKKVTFNLNLIEHAPKDDSYAEPEVFQEGKLSQIDEKSEENTPSSPEIKKAAVPPAHRDKANVHLADFERNNENHQNSKSVTVTDDGKCEKFAESMSSSVATAMRPEELSVVQCKETTSRSYEKIDSSPLFANLCFKTVSVTNEISTKYERTSNKKLHTPRPISFYSRSKLQDSCSPEFLVDGSVGTFLKEAPICTPLVLRNMARNTELSPDVEDTLSPVRLKLNFTEKETPRIKISEFHPSQNYKEIKTVQSRLDELADQECSVWLSNESVAVLCGRYITNPVAQTLADGDEMHFIPIKL